jgi:hypothetical protein
MIVSLSGTTTVAAGMTLTAVETVRVVDTTTVGGTLNLAGSTGIETVDVNASSGAALSITNVANLVGLNLTNTSGTGTTTLSYTASVVSGTEAQSIVLSNAAATGVVTVAGVETVNVSSAADGSVLNLVAAAATTVNFSGAGATTLTLTNAAHTSLTTVNGSTATGAMTVSIDPDLAATAIAVTTGAGADLIDTSAGALGAGDTINGGAGTDTVRFVATADTLQAAIGGATSTTRVTLTNVEALELQADDNAGAGAADFGLDMDTFTGVTSIVLDSNDVNSASDFVLTDVTAAQAGAISIQGAAGAANGTTLRVSLTDGTGTADTLAVTAAVTTGNVITIGDDVGDIENLTIALNGAVDSSLVLDASDFSTGTAATLTISGGATGRTMSVAQTTSNVVADVVNASTVASNMTITMGVADQTVTTGTGDDTIVFGTNLSNGDVVNGGAGTDRIVIDPATSITQAPTVTNVEELEIGATAAVSLVLTSVSIPTLVLQAQATNVNVVTLTNMAGLTNISATGVLALTLNSFNGITLSGTGYAGTADALTFAANASAIAVTTGVMTLTGIEDLTIAVTGSAADNDFTIGTGITGSSLNNIIVTSTGYGSTSTSTDIVLGNINDGGADTVLSFTAAGANTGVSATLADMAAGSTVTGSAFYDTISVAGSATGVIVSGGAGNDTLTAATGATTLNGDAGDDTLNGGAGDDLINGGAGNDTIVANGGADTISTGTGVDVVRFATATTTLATPDVTDVTVTDFTAGAGGDIIDLGDATGADAAIVADLIEFAGATNEAGLTITTGTNVSLTTGLTILTGVTAASLSVADIVTRLNDMLGDAGATVIDIVDLTANTDDALILISDGTNVALVHAEGDGASVALDAAELTIMAVFQNVAIADLTSANFADFI